MDISKSNEFTLQVSSNLALGAPMLTGTNTAILHSLLNMILKKINCQNEKVTITGYEAKQMEELLKITTQPILLFDCQSSATKFEDFDKLDSLEKCIADLESQLNEHLIEVKEKRTEPNESAHISPYQTYQPSSEESFSVLDPLERTICEQLINGNVAKLLFPRIVLPAVKAIKGIEPKLDYLETELSMLFKRITALTNKLELTDEISKLTEICDQRFTKLHEQLLKSLEDIQDILDTKVDRYEMTTIVNEIPTNLGKIRQKVIDFQGKEQRKRASSVAFERFDAGFHYEVSQPTTFKLPQPSLLRCEESPLLKRITENMKIDYVKKQIF